MRHRCVAAVMTTPVVRIEPGTGFQEIVALLAEYDITAVPVVDAQGRLVGIVSEADLLRKQASQEDASAMRPPRPNPDGPDRGQGAYARDLMSSPVLSTGPRSSVVAAARLMDSEGVKRLPVVDGENRLLGIVSRSDLLRVFLRGDEAIHREIVEDVLNQVGGVSPAAVGVEVDQGRAVLSGTVGRPELVPVIVRLCLAVDGVVSVTEHLTPNQHVPLPHQEVERTA